MSVLPVGLAQRHLGGVQVVLADEDRRQLPGCRQVETLVERAVVRRAVPEERHAHPVGFEQHGRVAAAGRQGDARPDDAAGAHEADLGLEQVHRAAAAARAAGGAAHHLGDQFARRHALGQGMAVAAVRAEHGVIVAQVRAHARRHRLLADVGMHAAVDFARRVELDQLLLGAADEQHGAVERQQLVFGRVRNGVFRHGCFTPPCGRWCRWRPSPGCRRPARTPSRSRSSTRRRPGTSPTL